MPIFEGGREIVNLRASTQAQIDEIEEGVVEIDNHLHPPMGERWFGLAAVPDLPTHAADSNTMTPFTATSGNDTWGAWIQISGSADTPLFAGGVKQDPHEILVTSVSDADIHRLQMGWDAASTDNIIANNQYTEIMFNPTGIGSNVSAAPAEIRVAPQVNGTLWFVRVWVDNADASDVDFFIGAHEYAN